MREIQSKEISDIVHDLCIKANKVLPCDLENCINYFESKEDNKTAKAVLGDLKDNLTAAKELDIPICQDTGMAVIFAQVGQEVHIVGSFEDAINDGVSKGYVDGFLRKSVVSDPFFNRVNSNDNSPAILHTRIVPGDKISITVAPKGFGSENMSDIHMFTPSVSRQEIVEFVTDVAKRAGSNPCPPMVIGVGIGGDFEYSAILAKKALCRSVSVRNSNPDYKLLEDDILESVNSLGIGPQGFGGKTTALCVNIETFPTHIAGLPIAVNIGCHVTRHASAVI